MSSRGWAFGYLGGGLLLVVNLALVLGNDALGLSTGMAVRISLLSAALWWAGFTIIPFLRLQEPPPDRRGARDGRPAPPVSFGQLWATLKDLRNYPMTLTFLLAYLFYNDGIQTVIYSASVYGVRAARVRHERAHRDDPADPVRRVRRRAVLRAARREARRLQVDPLAVCFAWMAIVVVAMFLPEENLALFLTVGIAIGIVLGGTQALSRSFFSLLIPRGREGEYFALYNAFERGTSWFGVLLFGVVFQVTGSYRPAIVSLIVFFVLGAFFLFRLDPARGIREAGNVVPSTL